MTDPTGSGLATPEWQHWQVVKSEPWPTPQALDEVTIRWRAEVFVALVVAAYSTVLGGLVGMLWPRVAPHVRLVAAINGSEAATKALLGDDMWLAFLGILAGLVVVAGSFVLARDATDGPGGVIGLAVGGILGSLVAAQVGHLEQHPHVVSALNAAYPGLSRHSVRTILGYFDFKLRAEGVLVAWPVAAVAAHAIVGGLRSWRRSAGRGSRRFV
ncbi:MAG TPA: DUF2567 domain-containing protein [Mycobacteriales bacterium]|nr:DUF2567 domain-containing protein [Mycobacteriales bacterium]